MLAVTLSFLSLLSAVSLLPAPSSAQDFGQVGENFVDFDSILDPLWSDAQLSLHNQMCTELGPNSDGLQGKHGVDTWQTLRLDNVLLEYLGNNPPIDDWTGRLYRDHLAIQPIANFRCQLEQDTCLVAPGCASYRHKTGPWLSMAIANLQLLTKAHIQAYDRALELLGENNQALAKSLFQVALGRDRTVFDVKAFFDGFFQGVELILDVSSPLGAFKEAIKFLAKEQLDQRLPSLSAGSDPVNDPSTFLASVRESFTILQNAERTALAAFMDSGVVNGNGSPANQDIVAFFEGGKFLNIPTFSTAGLVTDLASVIIRQMAAKIVASTWAGQGAGISIRDQRLCDDDVCSFSNCGPQNWRQKTSSFEENDFGSPKCLDIGRGRDIPDGLVGTLAGFGLNIANIHRNAAKCALLGQPGIDTTVNDFGFPRCTFNLPRRDTI